MVIFFLIIALFIAILAVIFALQNAGVVTVTFFASQLEGSLALVLLVTFVVGVLVGVLLILPYLIRKTFKTRRLSRELADSIRDKGEDGTGSNEDIEAGDAEYDEY